MEHCALQRPAIVDKTGVRLLRHMQGASGDRPPRQQQQRRQNAQRHDAEPLIGVAPADPVDQHLRSRQQQKGAHTGGGVEDRHRGRQSPAEPAAEQDRARHVADQCNADPDTQSGRKLELPECLRARGNQEGAAEQQQPERIGEARPGAVEQPADQRRHQSAGEPGQRIDRDHLGAVPGEALRDRLQENRKTVAEAAADHLQHEAQRQHAKRGVRRLAAWLSRLPLAPFFHAASGSAFPRSLARLKKRIRPCRPN